MEDLLPNSRSEADHDIDFVIGKGRWNRPLNKTFFQQSHLRWSSFEFELDSAPVVGCIDTNYGMTTMATKNGESSLAIANNHHTTIGADAQLSRFVLE